MGDFRYRLLFIDDQPLYRELFQRSLSGHGYEVGVANNGFAALRQMRRSLPDLIIVDLKMPIMSGLEFLSIARRRFPQIPTIAISGEVEPPIERRGELADSFFAKPFEFEDLLATIADLLRAVPPGAAQAFAQVGI